MFKLIGKLIKWLMIGFVVGVIFYSLFQLQVLVFNISKRIITNKSKIVLVKENINKLYDNDMQLLNIIIENNEIIYNEILETTNYTPNIEKLLNSSVFVSGFGGAGSGTVIKKTKTKMYILTCYHVIKKIIDLNKQDVMFTPKIGYFRIDSSNKIIGKVVYTAKVLKHDEDVDLALLEVSYVDNELEEVFVADTLPKKGDTIYTIGNPLGILRTISKGILSATEDGYYYIDNTLTYGNSGGGLFNIKGELIGVPSNVMVYDGGLNEYDAEVYVPESGLGLSRDLITIRVFLAGIDYE